MADFYECYCDARFTNASDMDAHAKTCLVFQQCAKIAEERGWAPPATALEQQVGGSHYRDKAIQPIEFIHANGLSFIEGSVVKYVSRWRDKNGAEDLLKARHYIDLLIELENLTAPSPGI
jgi:hypothetical protein